ncbi:response regulator [Luteibacter yeojuensis]|uniref:Response regulator n=1 Tax=Luteibacter yeojuensis TaxID=345309 RepID=A0A7X5TRX1_9GAMM|nr:response regulator [Luteibacter yeojuensis]NID17223.1 response regulator [Luteibacter yeojuensis]
MATERPLVVLLVEDDDAIREISAMILEDAGHEVHAMPNGDAAERWLDARTPALFPDVLFTDVRMPGRVKGQDLALRHHVDMHVLVTSGEMRDQHPWLVEGMGYLPKPYDRKTLLAAVEGVAA